jgi:DNA-binding transcriptional MocR family regulator
MTNSWIPNIEGEGPVYISIIKALVHDIRSGALASDTRLPTHRELSDILGVATGTVTRAYTEAERRGLIHSEGRRGTFVGKSSHSRPALSALMEGGEHLIDLSKNHPTYSEDPDLASALKQLWRRRGIQSLLEYAPSEGHMHHRAAGARWMAHEGMDVSPESIIITAGAQHAIMLILMAIAERGDCIAAEMLTYPGIKAAADLLGLELDGIALDSDGPIPEAFEALCRRRRIRAVYCNSTLHNPTAAVLPEKRRRDLAAVAEKYDVLVIEDEILRPLISDPPPPVSSFAPDRSFLILSTSKVVAAGLRVGFVAGPDFWRGRLLDCLRTAMLSLPALPFELFVQWLDNGTVYETISRRRNELRARMQLAGGILAGYNLSFHPDGSHLWLRLPENRTTAEFTLEAHRRGVSVAPAEIFAVEKSRVAGAVRVTLGTAPNRSILKTGLEILAETLRGSKLPTATSI